MKVVRLIAGHLWRLRRAAGMRNPIRAAHAKPGPRSGTPGASPTTLQQIKSAHARYQPSELLFGINLATHRHRAAVADLCNKASRSLTANKSAVDQRPMPPLAGKSMARQHPFCRKRCASFPCALFIWHQAGPGLGGSSCTRRG